MCSHYRAPDSTLFKREYGRDLFGPLKTDLFPGYLGPALRRPAPTDPHDEAVHPTEGFAGVFGLLPFWAKDETLAKMTYNCRSETAAVKPAFRDAWKHARHCIIPAPWFYEPDWRSGKAIPTRISRADGEMVGIAGLWERWQSPAGHLVHSFTMLTVNADDHELMRNFHRPGKEKRMVVILPKAQYDDWLDAPASSSMEFMRQYPADQLVAVGEPKDGQQALPT